MQHHTVICPLCSEEITRLEPISLIWLPTIRMGFPLFSTAKGRRFPRWLKGTRPSEISTRSGCRSFIAWPLDVSTELFNELPTDRSFMVLQIWHFLTSSDWLLCRWVAKAVELEPQSELGVGVKWHLIFGKWCHATRIPISTGINCNMMLWMCRTRSTRI